MAESAFSRRMMAQKLMTDARPDPFSDSRFFAGKMRPSMADINQPTTMADARAPAATASLFAPGAGIADVMGYAPDPMQAGQMLPSFGANVRQGNYLDAGLQTLGVAGDVLQAGGAFVPPLAAVGTALKAPRAARVADAAMDAADAAKIDPNQATGAAMDAAQARYFETGKFEPPTAENPVSIVQPTETEPGIIAFHGSGADFDEFRLEMIGTGEGAQAYGYGLYFTDSEDIAKFYRQTVGGGTGIVDFSIGDLDLVRSGEFRDYSPGATPFGRDRRYRRVQGLTAEDYAQASLIEDIFINEGRLYNEIKKPGAGVIYEPKKGDELKDELINIINETLNSKDPTDQPGEVAYLQNIVESVARGDATIKLDTEQYGKTYKVGLAPKPDELLDYDLPLSQQPKKYKAALDEIAEIHGIPVVDQFGQSSSFGAFQDALIKRFESQDFQNELYGRGNRLASELMTQYGIPGIKYRAAGSRATSTADEAAERNYVIFDDKAVNIMEKYGIVGPVAVTAAGAAAVNRGRNENDNGGSILPDAGIM